MYCKFSALLNWMRESFREQAARDKDPDRNLGYIDRFERLKAIKFLAIDEVDKIRETGFADEFRFDFLDERYQQAIRGETVTVFASNSDPSTFPEPIYDRLRDGRFQIVENHTPSARPAMGW